MSGNTWINGFDKSTLVWYFGHALLFVWFSVFIAPLRHADKANVKYFWCISFMTLLLIVSAVCHAPRLVESISTQVVDTVAFAWAAFPICMVCLQLISNISKRVIGYTITSPLRALLSNALLMTFAVGLQYTWCLERGFLPENRGTTQAGIFNFATVHCSLLESPVIISIPIVSTTILLFLISELVGRLFGASFRFFQSRHRRHAVGGSDHARPHQLPMVPWFSLSLTTTAIQLLVSLKIFVGRLDIRHILNAVCKEEADLVFDLRTHDPWIDFTADGGDGFNSSYAVARMLAQPNLNVHVPKGVRQRTIGSSVCSSGRDSPTGSVSAKKGTPPESVSISSSVLHRRITNPVSSAQDIRISPRKSDVIALPRASVTIHGGDLAYPRPSSETYRLRFVAPFEAALPAGPGGGSRPRMFLIPGNHDHYDGLESFVRFIIGRASLGGWKLPQKSSYFALQLPKGWWLLGMDIGITDDVDVFQYGTFCKIIETRIGEHDRVVVLTHRPQWVSDHYNGVTTGELFHQLLDRIGASRLAVRLAGDLHHYQRYSDGAWAPALVTSGGGGAFLHPTHVPDESCINEYFGQVGRQRIETSESDSEIEEEVAEEVVDIGQDSPISPERAENARKQPKKPAAAQSRIPRAEYKFSRVASFPSEATSRKLAWMNLVGFRDKNWGADIIFGSIYFLMGISLLPICSASIVVSAFKQSLTHGLLSFIFDAVLPAMRAVYLDSTVSLLTHLAFLAMCFGGAKSRNNGKVQKLMITISHFMAHAIAAISLFCVVEVSIEYLSQLAGGRDSVLADGFRVPGIVTAIDNSLFGSPILEHSLEWLLRFVDFPSSLVRNRQPLCHAHHPDAAAVTRDLIFRYLWRLFPFYWVIATPVAAQIMGTYLFVCINWLGVHMNEAFSSLRIEDYKHFLRMYIDPVTEDLHVYVIGVDHVAKHWEEDPAWDPNLFKAAGQALPPSSKWVSPSRWRPSAIGTCSEPTLVDYFVVPKDIPKMERTRTTKW